MRLLLLACLGFTLPAFAQYKMQTPGGEAPGPWLFGTIGIGKGADGKPQVTALKGLAIKLGDNGEAGICYDLELCRVAGIWTGGKFVTPMNLMSRGEYPTALGSRVFSNAETPGFLVVDPAQPVPSWKDSRSQPFGPLPPSEVQYKGTYVSGEHRVLRWAASEVEIIEVPLTWTTPGLRYFGRLLQIGPSTKEILVAAPIRPQDLDNDPSSLGKHPRDIHWLPGAVTFAYTKELYGELERSKRLKEDDPKRAELLERLDTIAEDYKGAFAREQRASWVTLNGTVYARVAPCSRATTHVLAASIAENTASNDQSAVPMQIKEPAAFTKGGRGDPLRAVTHANIASTTEPYVVDTIPLPEPNPWGSPMFIGGFDFFPDGRAAVCTFHGDVFIVSGIDEKLENVTWQRFASGLYHPFGLKIVNNEIYVTERSGVTRLKDLNADGEADLYEPFNWDVQVTKSFHEFAFDLQTDAEGNFYFAKAGPVKNGGRGFDDIAAHHGTLMRVSPDGRKLDVVATGFRAPNGIGVGPNGELTSGDNEGTWTPACKINWIKPGGFYGVVDLAHRTPAPTDYDRPLCWLPKRVDNSSGGQVWVPDDDRWGPWRGQLLHLSYGHCALFGVMREEVITGPPNSRTDSSTFWDNHQSLVQGGVVKFPLKFDSGVMRGRFNPLDGQLYVAGLRGWQTDGAKNGCFQRVRYTGGPVRMPVEMHARKNGIALKFACSLDTQSAADPENWNVEVWNYIWSSAYGSPEVSTIAPAEEPAEAGKDGIAQYTREQMSSSKHDTLAITSVSIGTDDRTVFLEIPGLKPVMQMSIRYAIRSAEEAEIKGEVINTIHALSPE